MIFDVFPIEKQWYFSRNGRRSKKEFTIQDFYFKHPLIWVLVKKNTIPKTSPHVAGPKDCGYTAPPCESETVEVVKALVEVLRMALVVALHLLYPRFRN